MGLIRVFKNKIREMAAEDIRRGNVIFQRAEPQSPHSSPSSQEGRESHTPSQDSKGIALLMVIAAVSTLSFLVTEFTYVAQLNQKLAYDELDQVKALYLAKSGFKLSLLRLKAFRTVKGLLSGQGSSGGGSGSAGGGGGSSTVPAAVLDQIWAFPFMYPIPPLPGLTLGEKDAIDKFQKESGFEGRYSAIITSESSRLNLNMILAGFQPAPLSSPSASPSPSPSPSPTLPGTPAGASPTPSPSPSFDPEAARKNLQDYFQTVLQQKYEQDPDFQSEYRDFRVEDFMDNLVAWADPSYERKQSMNDNNMAYKRGPFYSVTELHMLPGMDDQLYDLFAPTLTVSRTPGININTIPSNPPVMLRAMVPQMTDDEVTEFFKFRDDPEQDNHFKDSDAFFTYLKNSVAAFKSDDALNKLKEDFKKRNIRIVTNETEFKITVKATVNQSTRLLEAWVTLTDEQGSKSTSNNKNQTNTPASSPSPTPNATPQTPDTGLKVNFMRIL
jgi:type II secretory pathway component PulK